MLCDNEWMLYSNNGWKNEWMLDVNGEFRVMLGGGRGGGAKWASTFTWLALLSREY